MKTRNALPLSLLKRKREIKSFLKDFKAFLDKKEGFFNLKIQDFAKNY